MEKVHIFHEFLMRYWGLFSVGALCALFKLNEPARVAWLLKRKPLHVGFYKIRLNITTLSSTAILDVCILTGCNPVLYLG